MRVGSGPGGIRGAKQGACFVFPLFMENIPRNLFINSMENSTALPPSERRDLWGVGTVYGRTLTHPSIPGETERYAFRDRTRKRFYKRNVRSVRSETRTRVLDDVMCEGTLLSYRVKYRSITQPRVILLAPGTPAPRMLFALLILTLC